MVFLCVICRRPFTSEKSQRSHLKQNLACAAAFRKQVEEPVDANGSIIPPSNHSISDSVIDQQEPFLDSLNDTSIPEEPFHAPHYIQTYPEHAEAGHVIGIGETAWETLENDPDRNGEWGGFANEEEWEMAHWIMKSSLSHRQIDKFLDLSSVKRRLGLTFHNKRSFLQKVDSLPTFNNTALECEEIELTGDIRNEAGIPQKIHVELWKRNPVEVIREIIGNPALKDHLSYAPVKIFTDESQEEQIFNEMNTGNWWWKTQAKLPPKATIAPVIISSDATRLSQFGGDKVAWPVYLSIGNVSKHVHRQPKSRAMLLLGYLPVSKFECFTEAKRTAIKCKLFHYCMKILLRPLIEASRFGVNMTCGDGKVRRVYPIFATYIADHPEQCLVACCKESRCPKCLVQAQKRGCPLNDPSVTATCREHKHTLQVLRDHANGFETTMDVDRIRDDVTNPFWEDLPHSDIFAAFTPDLLHQIHKGVFKDHLLSWCSNLAGKTELDSRFKTLPTHAGLRHFNRGISVLSQWTGTEAKEVEKVFLGVLANSVDDKSFRTARGLFDFIYYANFSTHSTETLKYMQAALNEFDKHKEAFILSNQCSDFNIPKLHSIRHYCQSISDFGTTDGFNTELPERLHIDFAKEGYYASNHWDHLNQMVSWLQRQETVDGFEAYLCWRREGSVFAGESDTHPGEDSQTMEDFPITNPDLKQSSEPTRVYQWKERTTLELNKVPAYPRTSVEILQEQYGASNFLATLKKFLVGSAPGISLPSEYHRFDVYKRIRLTYASLSGFNEPPETDLIRATPAKGNVPAYFDTAIVDLTGDAEVMGIEGAAVVQVRVIFTLPPELGKFEKALAYVEYFTSRRVVSDTFGMYVVRRAKVRGQRKTGIIPLEKIRSGCHLFPVFNLSWDSAWTSENVLEKCESFFINPYLSKYFFQALSVPYK